MPKPTKSQIRRDYSNRLNEAGKFWLDRQPADMGNYAGVVVVPNKKSMVYVRLSNGQVIEVFNDKAPNIYNWKVYVGRDKSQPALIKIVEVRWIYNIAQTVAYVLFHHTQHEYPNPDTVWVLRDQFLPLLVLPAGGFTFNLYGDVIYNPTLSAPIRVVDMKAVSVSAYTVSTGARYVTLEITPAGGLNYIVGATAVSKDALEISGVIPKPTPGSFPVCVFEFYAGQTELRRDSTERTIIDLRMFTSDVIAGTSHTHTAVYSAVNHIHPQQIPESGSLEAQVFGLG